MPDLVAINGESKSALVLEVAICNSTDIINSRYTDKLVKYDTVEVRECVALETSGLTAGSVEVLPVVLNFRGAMSPVSRQRLLFVYNYKISKSSNSVDKPLSYLSHPCVEAAACQSI